jgi:hypothetical protein
MPGSLVPAPLFSAWALLAASQASASMDKVMRARQARQVRTWYWSSPASPLACCRHSLGALFQEPGVIGDQHPVRLAQLLHHIGADVIADPVHVPVRAAQQPLHAIGTDLAGPFRQRPAVLPLQPCDQPGHILPHAGPRLGTAEPARDPLVQLVRPGRDKIHHHALNDPSPDQLSAVAVLIVKTSGRIRLVGPLALTVCARR